MNYLVSLSLLFLSVLVLGNDIAKSCGPRAPTQHAVLAVIEIRIEYKLGNGEADEMCFPINIWPIKNRGHNLI